MSAEESLVPLLDFFMAPFVLIFYVMYFLLLIKPFFLTIILYGLIGIAILLIFIHVIYSYEKQRNGKIKKRAVVYWLPP